MAKQKSLTFKMRLRELRKAAGLSQARTAKAVGVHIQTYMRWERGETEPTFTELCVLAAVLGTTLNDFRSKDE
ncbi:helix-turn-helix transcriptional regulator [Gemmata sp. G18]|uniref:Helix-turn-helix transcriptional regulator n=1 Tax=Gemmata palustris TaxID=2822762 RepID=A0ABS5C3Y8_9BACT|nr:helix-turn-helix transcriptional regulator [Gemmata palustris]MBP3960696.1 helix-turn-helix transcriptional regulator [Gemmata palustris]